MLEMFMDIMDAIGLFCGYALIVCLNLLTVAVLLWGIFYIIRVLFGKDDVAPKTVNQKSSSKSAPIVYDWSDADEAQCRAVRVSTQAQEDSLRLHDMAVRDAWEAHTTACDMHNAAVEMHNDFACGGCDPWF